MSTMKVTNLKHESSSVNNIVLNSDGSVGGELATTLASKLDLAGGKILQVVSTTKTDTFLASVSVGTPVAVTGLTATITPASTANKVLVLAVVNLAGPGGSQKGTAAILTRSGTAVGIGDAAGNRIRVTGPRWSSANAELLLPAVINHLDSPATTSAVTYGFDVVHMGDATSPRDIAVNRTETDSDTNRYPRSVSSITLMEISA